MNARIVFETLPLRDASIADVSLCLLRPLLDPELRHDV